MTECDAPPCASPPHKFSLGSAFLAPFLTHLTLVSTRGGTSDNAQKICMNFGDELYTDASRPGEGALLSRDGRHAYVGRFSDKRRDGHGRLITDDVVLACRWQRNKPILTYPVRVDYSNGDRYLGQATVAPVKRTSQPPPEGLSPFSLWVRSLRLVRSGWGELVTAAGERFCGEWNGDLPQGFGCYLSLAADRYIGCFHGGKFEGMGVLFMSPATALSGNVPSGMRPSGAAETPPQPMFTGPEGQWEGTIVDGAWRSGQPCGEARWILPCGTQLAALWKGAQTGTEGEVEAVLSVPPVDAPRQYTWREGTQWDPLLWSPLQEVQQNYRSVCAPYRERLQRGEGQEATVLSFLANDGHILEALKRFCRCFYFLYGSCGTAAEAGAAATACGSALGWCVAQNVYGGCVHKPRGRPLNSADVNLALMDIFSFTQSVLRWTQHVLTTDEADSPIVHDRVVGRWVADRVLHNTNGLLLNLYNQAYREEERALSQALSRLRHDLSLDDMGVYFAREKLFEQLFDPYADAVRTAEQLGRGGRTLTRQLKVVTQWSKEIDLSTRLAVDTEEDAHRQQPGGADDLVPIHQYVLSRSKVEDLYAHSRLLADFVMEPLFVDPSSEESFSVITLQVCVLALSQLHPGIRDERNVLVPFQLECARIGEQVGLIQSWIEGALQRCPQPEWHPEELQEVVHLYLSTWVPHVVAALSTRTGLTGTCVPLTDAIFEGRTCQHMLLNDPPVPAFVRALCLWVGGTLLRSCCRTTLQLRGADGTVGVLHEWDFVFHAIGASEAALTLAQVSLLVDARIPLSGLKRVSELLFELL